MSEMFRIEVHSFQKLFLSNGSVPQFPQAVELLPVFAAVSSATKLTWSQKSDAIGITAINIVGRMRYSSLHVAHKDHADAQNSDLKRRK